MNRIGKIPQQLFTLNKCMIEGIFFFNHILILSRTNIWLIWLLTFIYSFLILCWTSGKHVTTSLLGSSHFTKPSWFFLALGFWQEVWVSECNYKEIFTAHSFYAELHSQQDTTKPKNQNWFLHLFLLKILPSPWF